MDRRLTGRSYGAPQKKHKQTAMNSLPLRGKIFQKQFN